MQVWKYPLKIKDRQIIDMPLGANPLKAGVQDDRLMLWALINPDMELLPTTIHIIGTGREFRHEQLVYIDTVQMSTLTVHVFLEHPGRHGP